MNQLPYALYAICHAIYVPPLMPLVIEKARKVGILYGFIGP